MIMHGIPKTMPLPLFMSMIHQINDQILIKRIKLRIIFKDSRILSFNSNELLMCTIFGIARIEAMIPFYLDYPSFLPLFDTSFLQL